MNTTHQKHLFAAICLLAVVANNRYCDPGKYLTFLTCSYPGCCVLCQSPCDDCEGADNGYCNSCISGFHLQKAPSLDYGACINTTCPNGSYSDGTSCLPCDASCSLCFDSPNTKCVGCKSGYYYSGFLTCTPCSFPCTECTANNCSNCVDGYYVNGGSCTACDPSCSHCVNSPNGYCTDCFPGFYLKNATAHSHGGCLNIYCGSGYYYLYGVCYSCDQACSLCFGNTNSQCLECIPEHSYYSDFLTCTACSSPCDKCLGPNYSTDCLTCVQYRYYFTIISTTNNSGSCTACHYSCLTCNVSAINCTSCNSSSYRIVNGSACDCGPFKMDDKLDHQECIQLVCDIGSGESVNSTGYCSVVCGDGLNGDGEDCDDHNLENLDGCSSECKIEWGFHCYNGTRTAPSVCKYQYSIEISLISVTKSLYSNSITFIIASNTSASFMNSLNYSSIISLGFPYSNMTFSFQDGIITLQVGYSLNLHVGYQTYTLSANFSQASPVLGNMSKTQSSYLLQSTNNLAINAYPPEVYSQIQVVDKFVKAIAIAGLAIFGLGFIRGKVIALELIGTLQLAYFGLVLAKFSDPLFYPMRGLVYTNGYNMEITNSHSQSFPQTLQFMGVYQELIENINIMFGVPVLFLAVSLLLLIVTKFDLSSNALQRIQSYRKPIFGEFFFSFLVFLLFQVSFCTGVMVKYFNSAGIMLYMSIAAIALYLCGLTVALVFFKTRKDDYFGEFQIFFKSTRLYPFYFTLHILQRLVIGALFGAFGSSYIAGIIAIVIILSHCVFVGIYKPYILKLQNIRSIFTMGCGVLTLGIYIYVGATQPGGRLRIYAPYAVLGVLGVCCLVSLSAIIIQIIRIVKIHFDISGQIQQHAKIEQKQGDVFEREMKKRLDRGQKSAFDLSKVMRQKRKKKRPGLLTQSLSADSHQSGDQLLERIRNFEKYQNEWMKKQLIEEEGQSASVAASTKLRSCGSMEADEESKDGEV